MHNRDFLKPKMSFFGKRRIEGTLSLTFSFPFVIMIINKNRINRGGFVRKA